MSCPGPPVRRVPRAWRAAVLGSLLATMAPALARAEPSCRRHAPDEPSVFSRRWPTPLDRPLTLEARGVTLREAIDRLADRAGIRVAYVAERLPLERRVCVSFHGVPVGRALALLLEGTSVQPLAVGAADVVLAPPAAERAAGRPMEVLERVVVTGSAARHRLRTDPAARTVIDGRALAARGVATLGEALREAVPGVWTWEQGPGQLLTRYGSLRGASSFGVSAPKVYIDGVEVANPLLVAQLAPDAVERVEVSRGPQSAALHGAGALSGVVHVLTRHAPVDSGGPHLRLRSTGGVAASAFAPSAVAAQQHALSLRAGSRPWTGGVDVGLRSLGEFMPGSASRAVTAAADVRRLGARSVVTGVARVAAQTAGTSVSPLLTRLAADLARRPVPGRGQPSTGTRGPTRGATPLAFYDTAGRTGRGWRETPAATPPIASNPPSSPGATPTSVAPYRWSLTSIIGDTAAAQSLRQYTAGTSASWSAGARWTHAVVAGVDGYRLDGVARGGLLPSSAADSALRASTGGADRGTLRASSAVRVGDPAATSATLTVAADYAGLREETRTADLPDLGLPAFGAPPAGGGARAAPRDVLWSSSTGLIAQATASVHRTLLLTAGVRRERTGGLALERRIATLPLVSGALVGDVGPATLRLRAAYGKAIRPPVTSARLGFGPPTRSTTLRPEEQAGVEMGADLLVGGASLAVTRFDQHATDLVQPVMRVTTGYTSWGAPYPRMTFALQNVGAIANRGWELEGTLPLRRLSLAGTMSFVDSRVERLATGYLGDLRAGDRMLEVPARTATLTAAWTAPRWSATTTVTHAADWVGYRRLALARGFVNAQLAPWDLGGAGLRRFWQTYDGATRVRATVTRDVSRRLSLLAIGENLLDQQRGEPDDVTVVPGRTIVAGVRARF